MTPTRILLGAIAVLLGLSTALLATTDVHYTDRNCGTALFGSDPNKLAVSTGNVAEDDFNQEALMAECAHRVGGRRFLTALAAGGCMACIIGGRHLRDRPVRTGRTIFGNEVH